MPQISPKFPQATDIDVHKGAMRATKEEDCIEIRRRLGIKT